MRSRWFDAPKPRILSHRGLATSSVENVLEAFAAAVEVGATYLESDVRATSDGHAILFHDETLERMAGRDVRVADLTLDQLRAIPIGGRFRVPTLSEALAAFPEVCWNLDIKSEDAVEPMARAIRAADAEDRILIASFSGERSRQMRRLLPGAVRSPAARRVSAVTLLNKIGLGDFSRLLLRGYDSIQAPVKYGMVTVLTNRVIQRLHGIGIEIHVWTVNDVAEAQRLLDLGVDGIITDRVDLMIGLHGKYTDDE